MEDMKIGIRNPKCKKRAGVADTVMSRRHLLWKIYKRRANFELLAPTKHDFSETGMREVEGQCHT